MMWRQLDEAFENLIIRNLTSIVCTTILIFFLLSLWILMVRSSQVLARQESEIRGLQIQQMMDAEQIRELRNKK